MRIIKPGNFHLNFDLNKIEDGVKTSVATSGEILFNAVRIAAYRYHYMTRSGGIGHHARYSFLQKLYMDTGNQQYDNQYLGGLDYTLNYKNSKNQNQSFNPSFTNFIPRINIDFYALQSFEGGSSPAIEVSVIDKITFTKTINGNTSYIEYKNISVTDEGYQSSWKDEGNPNP
jgi:hypothetical protein